MKAPSESMGQTEGVGQGRFWNACQFGVQALDRRSMRQVQHQGGHHDRDIYISANSLILFKFARNLGAIQAGSGGLHSCALRSIGAWMTPNLLGALACNCQITCGTSAAKRLQ